MTNVIGQVNKLCKQNITQPDMTTNIITVPV